MYGNIHSHTLLTQMVLIVFKIIIYTTCLLLLLLLLLVVFFLSFSVRFRFKLLYFVVFIYYCGVLFTFCVCLFFWSIWFIYYFPLTAAVAANDFGVYFVSLSHTDFSFLFWCMLLLRERVCCACSCMFHNDDFELQLCDLKRWTSKTNWNPT